MCIPGTMGIAPVEAPADPVEGFTNLQPMIFHYGHTSPSPNVKLFNFVVNQLAQVYEKKCQMNDKCELKCRSYYSINLSIYSRQGWRLYHKHLWLGGRSGIQDTSESV